MKRSSYISKPLTSMRIFVVRHGQTDFNLTRQPQRGQDPPINSTGIEESRRSSRHLTQLLQGKQIDGVFYSPLKRATQTMEVLMTGRSPPRISEPAQGLKQGCYTDDVHEFIDYSLQKCRQMGLQNVLVVTHGPVIRYMFQWLSDIGQLQHQHSSFHTPRNTAIAEIQITDSKTYILRHYDSIPDN